MNYKLSPSDMTFSYDGCKRCFYLKAVKGIVQPSIPIPSVFSKIASLLKNHYAGKQTGELHLALPPGIISHGERNVRSQVIALPNHDATCYINGRFDIVVSFEDGTYGIIDFKTGNPSRESAAFYSRQLHAYAYALEHPASNALALAPVTRLGLLYFYPSGINQQNLERLFYEAEITWIEIEKDEARFLRFIDDMLYLLEMPEAPPHSSNCPWCNYASRLNDF